MDSGPSNNLVLRRSQPIPGVSNGGVGSSIESRSQEPLGIKKDGAKSPPDVFGFATTKL